MSSYNAEYYAKNKDRILLTTKRWRVKNYEKYAESQLRYWSKQLEKFGGTN